MRLFYTDHFDLPLPDEHRFPMDKYRMTRQQLSADDSRDFRLTVPHAASDDELLLAHDAAYLKKICTGDLERTEEKRIGFPWSPALVIRSRYSTGATIDAARAALEDEVAANLAGGTHHAFADAAAGYCVFNDVIVAARVLQCEKAVGNVAVVDCDVHQGNGSAAITENDPSIFTFSLHGERNYPFRKATSDLDVALPDKTDDATYLAAVRQGLAATADSNPDFVFYIAGADPFEGDRLGRLNVSKSGLVQRDKLVYEFCRSRELPLAIAMGGGYAPDLQDIVDIHVATVQTAYDAFLTVT